MYKEKYIKYKTKYLELKNQLDSGPNIIQEGGWFGLSKKDRDATAAKKAAKAEAAKAEAAKAEAAKAEAAAAHKEIIQKIGAAKVAANNKIIEKVTELFSMTNFDFIKTNPKLTPNKSNENFMRILRISFYWLNSLSEFDILDAINDDAEANEEFKSEINDKVYAKFLEKGQQEQEIRDIQARDKKMKEEAERREIEEDTNEKAIWANQNMKVLKQSKISDEMKLVYEIILSYYYQNRDNFFKDYYDGIIYDKLPEGKQKNFTRIDTITQKLVNETKMAKLESIYDHQLFHLEIMIGILANMIKEKEDILPLDFTQKYINAKQRVIDDTVNEIIEKSNSLLDAYKKLEDFFGKITYLNLMDIRIQIRIKNVMKKKLDKKIKQKRPNWIYTTTENVKDTTTRKDEKREIRSTEDYLMFPEKKDLYNLPSRLPGPSGLSGPSNKDELDA